MSIGKRTVYLGLLLAFSFSSVAPLDACGMVAPCDCRHGEAIVQPIPEATPSCHQQNADESSKTSSENPCCGQCWLAPTPGTLLEPRPVSLVTPESNLIFTALLESTSLYVPPVLSQRQSMASERGQPPPGFLTLFHNLSPPSLFA